MGKTQKQKINLQQQKFKEDLQQYLQRIKPFGDLQQQKFKEDLQLLSLWQNTMKDLQQQKFKEDLQQTLHIKLSINAIEEKSAVKKCIFNNTKHNQKFIFFEHFCP